MKPFDLMEALKILRLPRTRKNWDELLENAASLNMSHADYFQLEKGWNDALYSVGIYKRILRMTSGLGGAYKFSPNAERVRRRTIGFGQILYP